MAAADAAEADLSRLLIRQQRLVIAAKTLAVEVVRAGVPSGADRVTARLLADELRRTRASLETLAAATGAAVGQAVVGRAASLAYLTVGLQRAR